MRRTRIGIPGTRLLRARGGNAGDPGMQTTVRAAADPKAWPRPSPRSRLRAVDIQIYRVCEVFTGAVILGMAVFSPWAFGTTQDWSIWTMTAGGCVLGLLFLVKLGIRWGRGYRPPRWPDSPKGFDWSLGLLTGALLGYCLLSAANARSTWQAGLRSFDYHQCVAWLPHSLDSASTWRAWWIYLGLAGSFWGIRDWLLGKSREEEAVQWQGAAHSGGGMRLPPPVRLRRLLWVLCVSGGLLAVEAIVQRMLNSPRLLFVVLPEIHQSAETQFGPYAYRANGAQYLNLLWPVCLGFWWLLDRRKPGSKKACYGLLASAALMAAAPIISTSRGGAIIAVGMALMTALLLAAAQLMPAASEREERRARRARGWELAGFFLAALALGFGLGWKPLQPRLAQLTEGLAARESDYAWAAKMAEDYPVFGIGPGAYATVSEVYRPPGPGGWWAQVHNDWLETRITFGWVGSWMIYAVLVLAPLRWLAPGGIDAGRGLAILTLLALAGCLIHARFDFPFQVHSVLFLFVILYAVLSVLSRRPG